MHHTRRSPRWRVNDYRRAGLYFVTICTAGRRPVFGDVRDGEEVRSALGEIARGEWLRTAELRGEVLADVFVVMPNHVHLLFGILDHGGDHRRDMMNHVPTDRVGADDQGGPGRRFGRPLGRSASSIIGTYKAAVTRRARREGLWSRGPLWQGRFHDRVVRDAAEADRIRRYVVENPARWTADALHPDRLPPPRR